ncbi:hypothetical protein ABI59_21145 [Acidobacteria bacterium Mor1]|nr:hypothetical protein ABI59_21145 [Acidobacteria bacterium Mor1]
MLITDTRGRLEQQDRCAREWLDRDGIGEDAPCWESAGLRAPDGRPFCSTRCAIRRQAARGIDELTHRVRLPEASGGGLVDLHSRVVPGADGPRIVHVLVPCPDTEEDREAAAPEPDPRVSRLTPREREILSLLAAGATTAEVAAGLQVSGVTVRNHVQHILHKLEVHSRLEAILAWMDSGERED